MLLKNEIILDTIDVSTLQLDELAIKTKEMEFLPLAYSIYETQMTYLVNSHNTFDIFRIFFPNKQLQILVNNTNRNIYKVQKR